MPQGQQPELLSAYGVTRGFRQHFMTMIIIDAKNRLTHYFLTTALACRPFPFLIHYYARRARRRTSHSHTTPFSRRNAATRRHILATFGFYDTLIIRYGP